jgi:hypothetical protein
VNGRKTGDPAKHPGISISVQKREESQVVQFAEYQLFAESTQYLSERRQTVAQIYLGVATGIFGVLGFLGERFGFGSWRLVLASAPLLTAGALVVFIWQWAIEEYRRLIEWRFERLIEMVSDLPGSFRMYTKEKAALYTEGSTGVPGTHLGYSRLERVLPLLFLAGYVLYGLAIVSLAAIGFSSRME